MIIIFIASQKYGTILFKLIKVNLYNNKNFPVLVILQTWANHLIYGLDNSHLPSKGIRTGQYFSTDVRKTCLNIQEWGRIHRNLH